MTNSIIAPDLLATVIGGAGASSSPDASAVAKRASDLKPGKSQLDLYGYHTSNSNGVGAEVFDHEGDGGGGDDVEVDDFDAGGGEGGGGGGGDPGAGGSGVAAEDDAEVLAVDGLVVLLQPGGEGGQQRAIGRRMAVPP